MKDETARMRHGHRVAHDCTMRKSGTVGAVVVFGLWHLCCVVVPRESTERRSCATLYNETAAQNCHDHTHALQ